MPAPAVSIIMPAFNRERYLAESIESVLNQTFADWELIVVDDGSSDSTPAIIERYCLSFPGRVKPISQANSGVAAARNTGIKASTGELVAFIDSDDLWHPRKLERQVQSLREAGDVAFVYTGYETIDPFGRLLLFGVPVIASDIGASRALVEDGKNGLLFRVGDAADLRSKVEYLAGNPGEVRRLAANVPRVKSSVEHAAEIESLYERVLSGNRGG